MSERKEGLTVIRNEIEAIDRKISDLLNHRAAMALKAGAVKREKTLDVYDPVREREILDRLARDGKGPFPPHALSSVFREIISACRSLETELSVAYFGPPGSYTHAACVEYFGTSIRAEAQPGIQEVFESIDRGQSLYGVVPVENSTEGSVDRTLDLFIDSEVKICAEVMLRISHELLSRCLRRESICRIYSHPQAFGQCRNWLRKNLPGAELIETASTSKAAEIASGEEGSAAVASSYAGGLYGLNAVASHIEDSVQNYTRFLVLGPRRPGRTGNDKTSVLFSIPHFPGALHRILKIIAERGINLTNIESRPMKGKPWEYIFFMDFDGHSADAPITETLEELRANVLFMKVLGSYQKAPVS
jgi:chorismate mutase / prephenate dehydratase